MMRLSDHLRALEHAYAEDTEKKLLRSITLKDAAHPKELRALLLS